MSSKLPDRMSDFRRQTVNAKARRVLRVLDESRTPLTRNDAWREILAAVHLGVHQREDVLNGIPSAKP